MSEPSGLWLRISPDPSRLYLGFLSTAHLLAVLGSLVSGIPPWVKIVLVLAILASWVFYRYRFRLSQTVNRSLIVYGEQDGWSFRIGEGPSVKAELLASTVATRWIVILHFKTQQNCFQSFLVLPDSVEPDEFHRLRMVLKVTGVNG